MYSVHVVFLPYFRQCALKTKLRGIGEVKTKNVLPFGQYSDKRTQTKYFLFTKHSNELYPLDVHTCKIQNTEDRRQREKKKKKCENITMASLT